MTQKSKTTAGTLALFLGGLGIHQFYLGNSGKGILYLLFCWTFIPVIIAFVDAIIIFSYDDKQFEVKYNKGYWVQEIAKLEYSTKPKSAADEIKKLSDLKDQNIISEVEFEKKKSQLLK